MNPRSSKRAQSPSRSQTPIQEAVEAALAGLLVILPTDTVYGIGTRPDDPAATARIFDVKRRPRDLVLPVLVASVEDAGWVAELDERAERIARAGWPGPLTLVLPRSGASRKWELGGDGTTVGVRMPAHPLALAVSAAAGPLAVTSANISGNPTPATCEGLFSSFGRAVAVYLCEEEPLEGRPSTVVDLAHGKPRLLRSGALEAGELEALLRA